MKLKLKSIKQHDCTVGVMTYGAFRCLTLELPDLDNKVNISCIPEGTYECVKYRSPKHGECISIKNVVGRTHILIHIGNFTSDILGCIVVGSSILDINNDGILDVANSGATFTKLMAILPNSFQLEITRC